MMKISRITRNANEFLGYDYSVAVCNMDNIGIIAVDEYGSPIEPEDMLDIVDEINRYLDELRESGATNMFGASPYLERFFGLKKSVAIELTRYWMDNFTKRQMQEQ